MEKPRLLVIEDTAITQAVLKSQFEALGCEVMICGSAEEAWEHLQNAALPHGIILDFQLPGEDGPSFFRRLSMDLRFKSIPVIPFTSLLSQQQNQGFEKVLDFAANRDTKGGSAAHPMVEKKDGQEPHVPPALILSVGHAFQRSGQMLPTELRKAMRTIAEALSKST
ncbi:MAG: response regulator [Elusimicrobia bacterium]|nr:response regulator [Elusimicrobiota bacterium]